MHIVALAGVDPQSTRVIGTELSGAHAEHVQASNYLVTEARVDKNEFTLVTLPTPEQGLVAMLDGGLMADTAIIVLSKSGWEEYQARLTDSLHVIGIHTVVVAIDAAEHSETLTHAIRQQLGVHEIEQSAVVNINTAKNDIAELKQALQAVIPAAPEGAYAGPLRLWPQKIKRKEKAGTVVVGFVTGNDLKVGDKLRTLENREVTVTALQQLSSKEKTSRVGTCAAVAIGDIDPKHLPSDNIFVDASAANWSNSAECTVTVRRSSDKELHATNAFVAQIGTFSCYASLHTLEGASLSPGQRGAVRVRFSRALPLFPNDRIALRDFESGDLIAVGKVNETALALDAVEKDDVEAMLRTRGWIDVEEYAKLSGRKRPATIGHWVVDINALEEAGSRLRNMITQAGASGIDTSTLNEKDLAVLRALSGIEIVNGRAFIAGIEPDLSSRVARSSALQL